MSLREIIKVPNPFLKVTAKPVTVIDENILTILDDMMETMYHANGIGLAVTFKKGLGTLIISLRLI